MLIYEGLLGEQLACLRVVTIESTRAWRHEWVLLMHLLVAREHEIPLDGTQRFFSETDVLTGRHLVIDIVLFGNSADHNL